jgi:OmcA/MtrC family decaheme c-type cytochrome
VAYPAASTLRAVGMESYFIVKGVVGADGAKFDEFIAGDAAFVGLDGKAQPRRVIVDVEKCNLCHERMGFHGERARANSPDYCATCHNTEMSSSNLFAGYAKFDEAQEKWFPSTASDPEAVFASQQPNNFKDMVHALHAGCPTWLEEEDECELVTPRSGKFVFVRGDLDGTEPSGVHDFSDVGYPARLTDCESCHKAGTYTLATPQPNALWTVVDAALVLTGTSPSKPELATRIAPTTSACGSCHDSSSAKAHYQQNTTYGDLRAEACSVCHGAGRDVDVAQAHADRLN